MVQPPFKLIQFLLFSAFLVSTLLFVFVITIPEKILIKEEQRFYCGTIGIMDKWSEQSEPMDSLELRRFKIGKRIFKESGCISCHDASLKKVGPPLAKVSERRNHKWIRQAIIDYEVLIRRKDKVAINLRKEYGGMSKPKHDFLTMEEVDTIIFYLDHVKKR